MNVPYLKLKCGCSEVGISVPYLFLSHTANIETRGNRRKRRVVCEKTGKFWYIDLPNLEEIKG